MLTATIWDNNGYTLWRSISKGPIQQALPAQAFGWPVRYVLEHCRASKPQGPSHRGINKRLRVRRGQGSDQYPNADTGSVRFQAGGVSIPHMIEHDGFLYVVYSRNKEDILVSRMAITEIV